MFNYFWISKIYLFHIPFCALCYSDGSLIRLDRLEYHIREELNKTASRAMVVLDPLKVCILSMFCLKTFYGFFFRGSIQLVFFLGGHYQPRIWFHCGSWGKEMAWCSHRWYWCFLQGEYIILVQARVLDFDRQYCYQILKCLNNKSHFLLNWCWYLCNLS